MLKSSARRRFANSLTHWAKVPVGFTKVWFIDVRARLYTSLGGDAFLVLLVPPSAAVGLSGCLSFWCLRLCVGGVRILGEYQFDGGAAGHCERSLGGSNKTLSLSLTVSTVRSTRYARSV